MSETSKIEVSPEAMKALIRPDAITAEPMKPCCGSCRWFNRGTTQCHRFPPTIILTYLNVDNPADTGGAKWASVWPNTLQELICGEYQRDPKL